MGFIGRDPWRQSPLFCQPSCRKIGINQLSLRHSDHQRQRQFHLRTVFDLDDRACVHRSEMAIANRDWLLRFVHDVFELCLRNDGLLRTRSLELVRYQYPDEQSVMPGRSVGRRGGSQSSLIGFGAAVAAVSGIVATARRHREHNFSTRCYADRVSISGREFSFGTQSLRSSQAEKSFASLYILPNLLFQRLRVWPFHLGSQAL